MFITILNNNNEEIKQKEIRKGIFIPNCFRDEAQFDRWYNETLVSGKYRFYHFKKENKPVIQEFENLKLKLKFS